MTPELQQKIEELAKKHTMSTHQFLLFKEHFDIIISSPELQKLAGYVPMSDVREAVSKAIDDSRERVPHPDWDYVLEDKQTYLDNLFPVIQREASIFNTVSTDASTHYPVTGEVKDGWVRVEDGLPEFGDNVLVSIENGWNTLMGVMYGGEWFCYYKDSFSSNEKDPNKVTHWKTLPSPPKQ